MNGEAEIEVRDPGTLGFQSADAEFGTATCPDCAAAMAVNPDMAWFTGQLERVFADADGSSSLVTEAPGGRYDGPIPIGVV